MTRTPYRGFRFPKPIVHHAVWLYARFTLSLRDVEKLLAERGVNVSYETIRVWVARFGPLIARRLRSGRGKPSDTWHLDEMFVRIGGRQMYLWRAGLPLRGFRPTLPRLHAAVANTFTTCRHLISANTHRLLRDEAFAARQQAAKLAA